jgi:hypothetical protein
MHGMQQQTPVYYGVIVVVMDRIILNILYVSLKKLFDSLFLYSIERLELFGKKIVIPINVSIQIIQQILLQNLY